MAKIVTLGEIMLRLSPEGNNRFIQSESLRIIVVMMVVVMFIFVVIIIVMMVVVMFFFFVVIIFMVMFYLVNPRSRRG